MDKDISKEFWDFLILLKDRLNMITDYKLKNSIILSDEDENILHDLFIVFNDNDLLNSIKADDSFVSDNLS